MLTSCVANKQCHCCGSHDEVHATDSDVVVRKGSHVLVRHGRQEAPPVEQTEAYLTFLKDKVGGEILEVRKNNERMAKAMEG